MRIKIFIISFFLVFPYLHSQNGAPGFPYISTFSPNETGSKEDNWSVIQDKRGVMYFANQGGILEYDGTTWNLIPIEYNGGATALAIDSSGRIYVGGINSLGYLAPDATGSLRYISLKDKLPRKLPEFTYIRKIIIHGDEIIIGDDNFIFRITKKNVSVFHSDKMLDFLFYVNGHFLINQQGAGLFEYTGDSLKAIPSGNAFKDDRVWAVLPIKKSKVLISGGKALYFYDGINLTRFKTEADDIFGQFPVFCALELPNDQLAFGTLGGGVAIVDKQGKLIHHLTQSAGLNNDFITSMYVDNQSGLWCTHMIGLSRIDLSGTISIIDNRLGIDAFSFTLEKHNGKYFAGTLNGLYEQITSPKAMINDVSRINLPASYIHFKRNPQISTDCRSLISLGNDLLVGGLAGTYLLRNNKVVKISDSYTEVFCRSKIDTNLVYAGEFGLRLFYYKNGMWIDKGKVKDISESIHYIVEDKDGSLWMRTENHGIINVKGIVENKKPEIKKYGIEQGLPSLSLGETNVVDGKIRFSFESGLYSYDSANDRFYPDSLFNSDFIPPLPRAGMDVYQMSSGNICVIISEGRNRSAVNYYIKSKDGKFRLQPSPVSLMNTFGVHFAHQALSENAWFMNDKGLYRCNFSNEPYKINSGSVLIRKVFLQKNDSLLYGGGNLSGMTMPGLSPDNNSITFEVSGLNYLAPSQTIYKFFMEGLDQKWSSRSSDTKKEYTHLPPGKYKFHVKAKNMYEIESGEAVFSFVILPHFWETWWFRLLMVFACISIIFYISRLIYQRRIIKLQHEQKQHEEFAHRLIESQEQERQRIASDLHDSIGQNILVIKNHAQIGVQQKFDNDDKDKYLSAIARIAAESLEEVRAISHNLHPVHLEEFGLKDALQSLVANVGNISKISLSLIPEFEDNHIPAGFDINIYRIVQELLNNIIKYSEAANALVQLTEENNNLHIRVNDDGIGMETIREGFGIAGIRERVSIMGGEFNIESKSSKGTSATAVIPIIK